ncbi:MAG: cytochrome c oxidase assembly protein [Terracidiphilus sp.]
MSAPSALQEILNDWTLPLPLTLTVAAFALVYLVGWLRIRRTRPREFPRWRLYAFELGMLVLWGAIGSPMDGLADALLSAHMVEHMLLMSVVPPLVLLGAPVVPLLRGLPRWLLRGVAGPLLRLGWLRRTADFAVRPVPAWLAMNITLLAWHVPAAYDFALENEHWHDFEHLCFLVTSLLFWWCLLRPWPARKRRLGWMVLPYLISADFVNTALSAFLAFCGRPVYSYYATQPNIFGVSLVQDQVLGAAIMWIFGSMAFLVPAVLMTFTLLENRPESARKETDLPGAQNGSPIVRV